MFELYKETNCQNRLQKCKLDKRVYQKYIRECWITYNDNIIANSKNQSKGEWNIFNKIQKLQVGGH